MKHINAIFQCTKTALPANLSRNTGTRLVIEGASGNHRTPYTWPAPHSFPLAKQKNSCKSHYHRMCRAGRDPQGSSSSLLVLHKTSQGFCGTEDLFPPGVQGQTKDGQMDPTARQRSQMVQGHLSVGLSLTFNVCHISNHNIAGRNQFIQLFQTAALLTWSQVLFCISYSRCFLGCKKE